MQRYYLLQMSDGNRGFSIYQLQFLWVWSFGARDERRGNQSLFPCLLHQHRFSLITPETNEDAYYSSIHSDNDPRYAEGEKYPGIQENECASTTFMSMSVRRLLLLGRLLLRLTRYMKGNELFTFKRITRSLFSFICLFI